MLTDDINITEFISDLVSTFRPTGTIVSIVNITGTNRYEITVDTLNDLEVDQYVEISGDLFKIVSVDIGTPSMTVVSQTAPSGSSYIVPAPFFLNARYLMADSQLAKEPDGHAKYPLIYLAEHYTDETDLNPVNQLGSRYHCRIYFMDVANFEDWNTQQHYENVINRMNLLANRLVRLIKANQFVQYEGFSELTRIRHPKWGLILDLEGGKKNIFRDKLSGIELELEIPIVKAINNCGNYGKWKAKNGIS